MKKLFTSTLLTVAAVPFLMAAPRVAKTQNQSTASNQAQSTSAKPKVHKKHVRKSQKSTSSTDSNAAATSTSSPKK